MKTSMKWMFYPSITISWLLIDEMPLEENQHFWTSSTMSPTIWTLKKIKTIYFSNNFNKKKVMLWRHVAGDACITYFPWVLLSLYTIMLSTRKTKLSALLLDNMSQFSSVLHTSRERAQLCVRLLDWFKLYLPKTILKSSKDIGSQSMAFYPYHYIVIELV